MSLSLIRTELKTILESVSGIGQVHDYKRYSADWGSYKKLFTKDKKVNEWEIQRDGFSTSPTGSQSRSGKVKDITHRITIRGFYAFNDACASEKTFDTLCDAITDKLIQDQGLGGQAELIGIPIAGEITFNYLGDVLCHMVEIKFEVYEREFL